jgi:hypothetical protein
VNENISKIGIWKDEQESEDINYIYTHTHTHTHTLVYMKTSFLYVLKEMVGVTSDATVGRVQGRKIKARKQKE